jgi:predicted DNA-binding WGR domain protein
MSNDVYLRYTNPAENADKVYHIHKHPDKVIVEYGRYGKALREKVYPLPKSGVDKAERLERAKRNKGYEDYIPSRFGPNRADAVTPLPTSKPERKSVNPEGSGFINGKVESEDIWF